ncbi:choice-of-anchor M domain-containing protein [Ruficoccus sp. ZRK36]|uniref:choice-of-anchor M domain-containing protein n=1 Tax=Ruficoccus sp. ZRK36 TaxID=2866311 RepID=UPI001C73AE08|nr:choice-of-anchor M domain-containing protein [Ruficoccus sp. ZRK36]QYY36961.1 choice-of-anchor M domain-containing protein [Ruficoccus sp. ZRK36]
MKSLCSRTIVKFGALAAAVLVLSAHTSLKAEGLSVSSALHTFYFGVETDRAGSTRLDGLHVDMRISYFGGVGSPYLATANLNNSDNAAGDETTYTPGEAHLYANSGTRRTMGQTSIDMGYGFIGAADGDTFWLMESYVVPGSIYLGLSSEEDTDSKLVPWNPQDPSHYADSSAKFLRLDLVNVNGPAGGEFAVFDYGANSPIVYMATSDGIDENDCYYLEAGGHSHLNWSFTQAGVYAVTFRITTVVVENYDNWLWSAGLTDSGAEGFTDQATPSALANGVRYALGLNQTGSAALPQATSTVGVPGFILEIPEPARPDITYQIWRTTDLIAADWAPVATKFGTDNWSGGVQTLDTQNARTQYLWSDTTAPASGEAVFYQLRVSEAE